MQNIGNSLAALGRYKEARETYDKYLEINRNKNDVIGEVYYYFLLGNLETSLKKIDIAEQYYQKAFTIMDNPSPIQPNLFVNNPLELMARDINSQNKNLLMQLGNLAKDRGNNKVAYEYYKKAADDRSGLVDFKPRVLFINLAHHLGLNEEAHDYGAEIRKEYDIPFNQGFHDSDLMALGNIEFENNHLDLARQTFLILLPKFEQYFSKSKSDFASQFRQQENRSYDLKIMQYNYEQLFTLFTNLAKLEQKARDTAQSDYYHDKVASLKVLWEDFKIRNNIRQTQ